MMLNCQSLHFSEQCSLQRMDIARGTLGENVVKRIICFGLYLLGASRSSLSSSLNIPPDTIKSSNKRILQNGIAAFKDNRYKSTLSILPPPKKGSSPRLSIKGEFVKINFDFHEQPISIPFKNNIQLKVVLLTLLDAGFLAAQDVSEVLGYTPNHVQALNNKLKTEDVYALIDKRQGQKTEYRFTPEIKAELVNQVAANVISGHPTSSRILSENLDKRCNLKLPERSIRFYINKLGLSKMSKSLPALVGTIKKTPVDTCKQGE